METTLVYIALFAPLVGSLFALCFSCGEKRVFVGVFASLCVLISLCASFALLGSVANGMSIRAVLMPWITMGSTEIAFSFVVDSISLTMMLVVGIVSSMVHIYSIGYMSHDFAFNRFFAALSAFVFAMLILVMSDNLVGLFIGWEGVGLCSWMLIGFWYHKESANFASNEAFIMNRIADAGMLLGVFLLFWECGTLQYTALFEAVQNANSTTLLFAALLLFVGAMGKSAQFPLHTWLADAMEGPTPVSALIHSATMVTAGVFLLIRMNPLYTLTPDVGLLVACLGAFVALFAASIALCTNDLKRIIAYSTLSQLGYMFVAAGLGAYTIALFHLVTHAFFKSLLFLGAGNIMHAMNDNLDVQKMGALYKPLRATAILMLIASLALSGIYPFAGFFSKDKILEVAFLNDSYILYGMLLFAAFLTAFYSFRLLMLVFFTPKRYDDCHPHEAPGFMLLAMTPLGILAIIAGFFEHAFFEFVANHIATTIPHADSELLTKLIIAALCVSVFGITLAIIGYKANLFAKCGSGVLYKILHNQYYIPQIYDKLFVVPCKACAKLCAIVDMRILDASIDAVARLFQTLGFCLSNISKGNLSSSLRLMVFGTILLLLFALWLVLG